MKEKVFVFREIERQIASARPGFTVLDIGCGVGDNLRRLVRYGARAWGIDPNLSRLSQARTTAPVVAACGEFLPWASTHFDMVYISHVLHHSSDPGAVLRESYRTLKPGGILFLIETVDDSPLMRLARALRPRWQGDDVLTRFRCADLVKAVEDHGFGVHAGGKFNWMYFAWELVPLALPALEAVTPIFIGIEAGLARLLRRWGGHCWLLASKPGPALFSLGGRDPRLSPPGLPDWRRSLRSL